MPNTIPPTQWFRNAIAYHIFIDRFSGCSPGDAHRPQFLGGNLQGIIRRLDYLGELGINTLWLSPFYQTSAYHGYHITDYFSVDDHFGTLDDLRSLIELAHQRDMKVVADFVPNHCSREHPFFQAAIADQKSPYRDWFRFARWPDRYLCFLDVAELPKINLSHQPAREHLINAAKYWLGLGIDGLRLDHATGPSLAFWREFSQAIKSQFPHAVLIGEAWLDRIRWRHLKTLGIPHKQLRFLLGMPHHWLYRDYLDILDGVLDFHVQHELSQYVKGSRSEGSRQALQERLTEHFARFPRHYYLPVFLDNHDMDRFLYVCGNDRERLKDASEILFSLDQPVILYYGTEVGLTQRTSIRSRGMHGDVLARQPMVWDTREPELFAFFQGLIRSRKEASVW